MDKQTLIDELKANNDYSKGRRKIDFNEENIDPERQSQIAKLKEDATIVLQENETLRNANTVLKLELNTIKEEAHRLKEENNSEKENFFTKSLEIESILSENSQLRKDSIILHRPCNAKVENLEVQLRGKGISSFFLEIYPV